MLYRALRVAHGSLAHLSVAKSQNLKLLAVAAAAILWPGVAAPQPAPGASNHPVRVLKSDFMDRFSKYNWNQKDGLSGASVNAISQTTDGYLWLGTGDGLVRFGGASFTWFRKSSVPQIIDNEITAPQRTPMARWGNRLAAPTIRRVPVEPGTFEHYGSNEGYRRSPAFDRGGRTGARLGWNATRYGCVRGRPLPAHVYR